MLLVKKEVSNTRAAVIVNFEMIADDLLMVSITNQIVSQRVPSYWRLTKTNGIPPLEIGIDCQQGMISNITLFIDGTSISEINGGDRPMIEGNIIVDTSIFTKENDYYDVDKSYNISICNDRLICSFEAINENTIVFRNDRIGIFVDSNNCIIGFSVCDLSEAEKNMIHSIQF